jgi:hypothetical protein
VLHQGGLSTTLCTFKHSKHPFLASLLGKQFFPYEIDHEFALLIASSCQKQAKSPYLHICIHLFNFLSCDSGEHETAFLRWPQPSWPGCYFFPVVIVDLSCPFLPSNAYKLSASKVGLGFAQFACSTMLSIGSIFCSMLAFCLAHIAAATPAFASSPSRFQGLAVRPGDRLLNLSVSPRRAVFGQRVSQSIGQGGAGGGETCPQLPHFGEANATQRGK